MVLPLVIIALSFIIAPKARADDNAFSWINSDPAVRIRDDSVSSPESCTHQQVYIGNLASTKDDICVYQADGFRYGASFKLINSGLPGLGQSYRSLVIGFPGDSRMYRVEGITLGDLIQVPNSKHLVFTPTSPWTILGGSLQVVKDIRSKLTRYTQTDLSIGYRLKDGAVETLVKNESGIAATIRSAGASANGKWLAVELRPGGYIRINMENFEMRWYSKYPIVVIMVEGQVELGVSDDGKHIATVGVNTEAHITELTGTCGRTITAFNEAWRSSYDSELTNPCPEKTIQGLINNVVGNSSNTLSSPRFDVEGGELTVLASSPMQQWITLRASGYILSSKIEYLALGDSYSSGEGDIEKKSNGSSYYSSGTGEKGGCHLSERSYPFLLRDHYKIPANNMRSVACSGAQVVFDYFSTPNSYRGQRNQLENLSATKRTESQKAALNSFKPGVTPQLEFVKKYTPGIITVTGGGNDVGFADILSYCASPSWQGVFVDDTCGYAIEGSQLEKLLNDAIDSQYLYNKLLLTKMKSYSPNSKIILVGYPSFIADSSLLTCGLNGGFLNGRERNMINRSVHEMNQMLRRVAHDSGVSFVNIEDSLNGGRLCEGSTYMTGLHNLKIADILNENTAESFHPNHKGNAKIAKTIQATNLFTNGHALDSGSYTPPSNTPVTHSREIIRDGSITRMDTSTNFSVIPYSFAANSSVSLTGYSDEIDLGTLQAEDDGSIQQYVDMKKLPIGRHVIVLLGNSFSGEPVQYYQFIEVKESSTDSDGDGIPDTEDRCNYIKHWYDEETGKDVCQESTSLIAKGQSDSDSMNFSDDSLSSTGSKTGAIQQDSEQSDVQSENKNIANAIINKIKSVSSLPVMAVTIALIILMVGTYGIIKYTKKHQE